MKPSHPARAVARVAVLLVALAPLAQAQSVSPNRYGQNPDNSSSSRPSTWERSREQARAARQQQDQAVRLANADRHRQALEDNRRRMENDRRRSERRMAHAASPEHRERYRQDFEARRMEYERERERIERDREAAERYQQQREEARRRDPR